MLNNFGKRSKSIIAIYAILLVLYILAFIVIPFPKTATSWIAFAFTILSILSSLGTCGYAFNCKNATGAIYGFPIFRIGLIYMIAQFTMGIVLCIICAFVSVPFWLTLFLSALLLGGTMIGVIMAGNTRDAVVEVEENTTESIKQLSIFNINIAGIIDACENETVRHELQELGNLFKYSSDPVSNKETKEIEETIKSELDDLKELILSDNSEIILEKIKLLKRLLAERNRICQATK